MFTLGYTCTVENKFFNIKGKTFSNKSKAKNWLRNNRHNYSARDWFIKDKQGKKTKI